MKDNFTAREVGVLVEELKSDFRAVAEVVTPLPVRFTAVEERLTKLEIKVQSLEDVVRIAIPYHEKRITRLPVSSPKSFVGDPGSKIPD